MGNDSRFKNIRITISKQYLTKASLYICINPLWPHSQHKSCLYTLATEDVDIEVVRRKIFIYLVYELQVLMDVRTSYVRVQSQTLIILVLWLLWNQLLVPNLTQIIWINVNPFICNPLDAMGDDTASMQSIFILLSDPPYWKKSTHLV